MVAFDCGGECWGVEGYKADPLVCGTFGFFRGDQLWSPVTVPEECTGKD